MKGVIAWGIVAGGRSMNSNADCILV